MRNSREGLSARGIRHIYVDGGATIRSFLAESLIDDLTITLIPVLLGTGKPLFGPLPSDMRLALEASRAFDFGFVQNRYRIRRDAGTEGEGEPRTAPAIQQRSCREAEGKMAIHLDHLMVPSRDKAASAKLLAELLGVPWSDGGPGPFVAVYLNDGLTLDFDQWGEPFPLIHYCFRVEPGDFDAILERLKAAGIPYRSAVHGPVDYRIDTWHGGRIVYWNVPDGHQWEMLTVSYARQA